jgi:hypothetical protein
VCGNIENTVRHLVTATANVMLLLLLLLTAMQLLWFCYCCNFVAPACHHSSIAQLEQLRQ